MALKGQIVLRENCPCSNGVLVIHLDADAVHRAHENHGIGLRSEFVGDERLQAGPFKHRPQQEGLING